MENLMGNSERRMVRKPATKFGNLQKKLSRKQTEKSRTHRLPTTRTSRSRGR